MEPLTSRNIRKCKIHKNPELIYVLDSARVKLCEAGKPFE